MLAGRAESSRCSMGHSHSDERPQMHRAASSACRLRCGERVDEIVFLNAALLQRAGSKQEDVIYGMIGAGASSIVHTT
jgi:hypothetical protein